MSDLKELIEAKMREDHHNSCDECISKIRVLEIINKLTVGKGLPYDHEFEGCVVADDLIKELEL